MNPRQPMWRVWTLGRLAYAQAGPYREARAPLYVLDTRGRWNPVGLGLFVLADTSKKIESKWVESSINDPRLKPITSPVNETAGARQRFWKEVAGGKA
jgi:hypothetical protein